MAELQIGASRMFYCNRCKGETHHELKAVHPREICEIEGKGTPFERLAFWTRYLYRFWICRGCDTATLEVAYTDIAMYDPSIEDYLWESDFYPKRAIADLPHKRFKQLNRKLSSIYSEVIECFNGNSRVLCAVGLRALLEGICADKGISGNELVKKIDGLKAYLPPNIVESLHSFRFMGNVAAHELQAPDRYELQLAIEVMEDLLNVLYELEYKAKELPKKP